MVTARTATVARRIAPVGDVAARRAVAETASARALRARGTAQSTAEVSDNRIDLVEQGITLDLFDPTVVLSGRIATNALLRRLSRQLPNWQLASENKWLSRGILRGQGIDDEGWVMHEEVRWPY